MKQPISTSIKFNGDVEITLTPYEQKDRDLLGHAARGNKVAKIGIGADGSVKLTLVPETSEAPEK